LAAAEQHNKHISIGHNLPSAANENNIGAHTEDSLLCADSELLFLLRIRRQAKIDSSNADIVCASGRNNGQRSFIQRKQLLFSIHQKHAILRFIHGRRAIV
jgi:hypothetical protein